MLAISEGTGGQYTGMPIAWLAGLLLSVVMLRSKAFSKATAWVGILGLDFLLVSMPFTGYTATGPATVAVNAIIAVMYIGGGLLSLTWYLLVGLRLFKLGQLEGNPFFQQA
jgi:phosphatidylserine synthase